MENSKELQSAIDEEHLRLLSLFHYIKGGVTVGFSLLGLVYFAFIAFILRMGSQAEFRSFNFENEFPLVFFSYLIIIIGVVVSLVLIFGVLQFLSGYYMKKKQNRLFSFVIGIIECIEIPYGTILGVMTMIVLSRYSVKQKYLER